MTKKKLALHDVFGLDDAPTLPSVKHSEINDEMPNRTVERSNERSFVTTNVDTFVRDNEPTFERTNVVTHERSNEPTGQRKTVRDSFEIFRDQQDDLDELIRTRWINEGKKPVKSAMIRDALDAYLAKEYKKLTAKE